MPISESAVASAIEGGIEKVIPQGVQGKSGNSNMADMLKRLGIKSIECADDVCMNLF